MADIVVVFTINNKFVTPTYITIQSLFQYAKENTHYECIILSENLTKKNKKLFEKLVMNTFHKIKFIELSGLKLSSLQVSYAWPKVVYWRLYLCDILNAYDKVIYTDVDVLFQDDLSDVWNMDIEDYEIAAVAGEKNDVNMLMHQYYEENSHEYVYWSGFMVMNLNLMRKERWSDRCTENLDLYGPRLKMFDLELMNLTAKKIKKLPLRYVYLQSLYDAVEIEEAEEYLFLKEIYTVDYMKEEKNNVVIIHYAGKKGKPWLRKKVPSYYQVYLSGLPLEIKWQNKCQQCFVKIRILIRFLYRISIKKFISKNIEKKGIERKN